MNARKKYYTFRAGQDVPRWLLGVELSGTEGRFKNKGAKIKFMTSCIVVRILGSHNTPISSLVMSTDQNSAVIIVKNLFDAKLGGVSGGSAVLMFFPQKRSVEYNNYLMEEIGYIPET